VITEMATPVKSKCSTGRRACHDRGAGTRERLIEVAVEIFSELSYAAASTRAIVQKAQTNLVSIPYYFGNKLGLYYAAAEYIGSNIAKRFRPACERARQSLFEEKLTEQETLQSFTDFIVEIADLMLRSDMPQSWGQFVYREQLAPTAAFDILEAKFRPVFELGFEYVSRLTKRAASAPETRVQFMAIMAMLKLTCVDRALVLRNTGWKSFGEEETRIVTEMLRRNLQALCNEE
jgi:TetR/AcrR family transcriptional regulator, regulator of cefoperazone and chloramphenicol sensitivity